MANYGNLRQYHLGEILRIIGDGLRRGRLVVERGGLRADLYCENGYLVYIWRSGPMPPLAQRWVSTGFIAPGLLAQVAAETGIDPALMEEPRLAQEIVDRGFVTRDEIAEWSMNDAMNLLGVIFAWRDGDYRFEDGMTAPPSALRVPLAIPLLLNRVVQRGGPWQNTPPTVSVSLTDVLDFADIRPDEQRSIQITRDQWRVLTLLAGQVTLEQIAQQLISQPENSAVLDPQRYALELRRSEEGVLRLAGELIGDGVAVAIDPVTGEATGHTWRGPAR